VILSPANSSMLELACSDIDDVEQVQHAEVEDDENRDRGDNGGIFAFFEEFLHVHGEAPG
jgi:hypothetical protein